MARLGGIIYEVIKNYVVLRGFAPIGDLAEISIKPKFYQRDTSDRQNMDQNADIVKYLSNPNSYFPEITLARSVSDYKGLIQSIGTVDRRKGDVKGLHVSSEKFTTENGDVNYAYLEIKESSDHEKLIRIDGNRRLELFSDTKCWYSLVPNKDIIDEQELKKEAAEKRAEIAKIIVPFTVILSNASNKDPNNFEAQIFYDINFTKMTLREESLLKIMSKLKVNYDGYGLSYPLVIDLIKEIQNGSFNAIYWLKARTKDEQSYFRDACSLIVKLLLIQKEKINDLLNETKNKSQDLSKEIGLKTKEIKKLEKDVDDKQKYIKNIEFTNPDYIHMTAYKASLDKYDELRLNLNSCKNEQDMLDQKQSYFTNKTKTLQNYINNCDNKNAILSALTDLINVYKEMGEDYGSISYLCALVYYSLLDTDQLRSFIDWSKRNGINKIKDRTLNVASSLYFITMFDHIHQAKKNEIFISMQFGDSQSELIYEKIVRTIEKFNSKYNGMILSATPIRIDRTIEPSAMSTIQEKIMNAIKSCGLIIADLSSSNVNVYHEIGYAMGFAESHGIAPNIILLYKENTEHNKDNKDIDKFIGFNLRNLPQLRFSDYDQLGYGLMKRLEKYYEV